MRKKTYVFIFSLFFLTISFSQNYIGKNKFQVLIESQQLNSETHQNFNVYIDTFYESDSTLKSIVIHEPDIFKITMCYFHQNICVCFKSIYYNLSKTFFNSLIRQTYGFYGENQWICYQYDDPILMTLDHRDGNVFVVLAYGVTIFKP